MFLLLTNQQINIQLIVCLDSKKSIQSSLLFCCWITQSIKRVFSYAISVLLVMADKRTLIGRERKWGSDIVGSNSQLLLSNMRCHLLL